MPGSGRGYSNYSKGDEFTYIMGTTNIVTGLKTSVKRKDQTKNE